MKLSENGYTPPDSFDAQDAPPKGWCTCAPGDCRGSLGSSERCKAIHSGLAHEEPPKAKGSRPITNTERAGEPTPKTPHHILREMGRTFEERGKIYGDNWKRIGVVMDALAGGEAVTIEGPDDWLKWSLFFLMVTKMTRLATTDIEHIDSVHDLAVYAAMLESALSKFPGEKA